VVALVIPLQESVVVCPATNVVGFALNAPMTGVDACTVTLHFAVVPRATVTL